MTLRLLCVCSILLLLLCAIRFHIEPAATATPPYDAPMVRTQVRTHKTPTTPTYTTPDTFYQTIIDANIFRPLGWRKPVSRPQFQLIATITGIKNTPPNALILHKNNNTLHTLTIGETLGKETTLTDVKPKHVILKNNDKQIHLTLTNPFLR